MHFRVPVFSRWICYLQTTHNQKCSGALTESRRLVPKSGPPTTGPPRIETIFVSNDPQKYFERKVILLPISIFNRFQATDQNVIINKQRNAYFIYDF